MNSIQPLEEQTVRLLAAGEIIDSPLAVVRELVDNSLDSGADRIRVSLWPELWRLQVQDNGRGIALEDLPVLARAHTTSKLRVVEDLWGLATLGFRGEGLHSIASVASLEVMTCPAGTRGAVRACYDECGELLNVGACAGAPGTVVTVDALFGRQPVRRRFLSDHRQQVRRVVQMLQHYALAWPAHVLELWVDGRVALQLWPASTIRERVVQLLPGLDEHDLREVRIEAGGQAVTVTLGLPDRCSRARADWLQIYVNGRFVRNPELEGAVRVGFERTLRRGRHPVCLVHLELGPGEVDWNRHPAKLEVALADPATAVKLIAQAIDEGLRTVAPKPAAGLLRVAEASLSYQSDPPERGFLKALTQMHGTYILAEYPGGICLVEQHVAHERVLFEQMEAHWEVVVADPPILVGLSEVQAHRLMALGIELENFGEGTWLARTVPQVLSGRDCAGELTELSQWEDLQDMRVALACRTAIRNGTRLELGQMQDLLDNWQRTRNPHTCPHGRPIYMPLTDGDLARFFRRNWHICGS